MIFRVIRHISASRQKVHWQVLILLEEFCTSFWKNDTPVRRINTLLSKIVVVGLLKLTSSSTTKIIAYHKSYFQKYKAIRQIISSHSNESNATLAGNRSMEWNKGPQNRATHSQLIFNRSKAAQCSTQNAYNKQSWGSWVNKKWYRHSQKLPQASS